MSFSPYLYFSFVFITIFSILEDKIIWTSETKTINPTGVDQMTKEISKVLYKRMVKEGFLKRKG